MYEHLNLNNPDAWPEPNVLCTHPLLTFCRTPADYYTMFSCETGSCMTHDAQRYFPVGGKFLRYGIMNAMWFHYNPHTQGVFLQDEDGTVLARNILLRDDVTKPFSQYFGDRQAVSPGAGMLMREILNDLGYEQYGVGLWGGQLTITEPFEIPGYELDGKMYCPLPFHDSVDTDYFIAYDHERNVFEFGPIDAKPMDRRTISNHSTYDYNGFVPALALM